MDRDRRRSRPVAITDAVLFRMAARYIVGIDLGTTNSARRLRRHASGASGASRSFADPAAGRGGDRRRAADAAVVPLPRRRARRRARARWRCRGTRSAHYAVGEFARAQGARVPGRLVTSAKSWLCHGGVDREAAILPWAAPDDVREAVAGRGLGALPAAPARGLGSSASPTRRSKRRTSCSPCRRRSTRWRASSPSPPRSAPGCRASSLLEEPQAAFYAWIDAHDGDVAGSAAPASSCVAGGRRRRRHHRLQPDRASRRDGERLALERLAVGDHILLGGDNIDVALARLLEPRLGEQLDSQRWHALTNLCRAAKEALLGRDAAGRGADPPRRPRPRRRRRRAERDADARRGRAAGARRLLPARPPPTPCPRRTPRAGLQEWGLPFAASRRCRATSPPSCAQHAGDRGSDGDARSAARTPSCSTAARSRRR